MNLITFEWNKQIKINFKYVAYCIASYYGNDVDDHLFVCMTISTVYIFCINKTHIRISLSLDSVSTLYKCSIHWAKPKAPFCIKKTLYMYHVFTKRKKYAHRIAFIFVCYEYTLYSGKLRQFFLICV